VNKANKDYQKSMYVHIDKFYVLCYIVLPSRSGSRTLGIKDTFIRLD